MIDEQAYHQGERVDGDLDALIDRADAKRRASGELSIEEMLNARATRRRAQRRRQNIDAWKQFHEDLAESMRAEADRQQAKADALAELGES